MADYSQNIANLEAALASGERRVEIDGQRVDYQSPPDMIAALNYFRGLQSAQPSPAGPVTPNTLTAFERD